MGVINVFRDFWNGVVLISIVFDWYVIYILVDLFIILILDIDLLWVENSIIGLGSGIVR